MGGGGGNGKLQGEIHITSFPWTTNEREVYSCFIDEKLKFWSWFLYLENIIVIFSSNTWLQRIASFLFTRPLLTSLPSMTASFPCLHGMIERSLRACLVGGVKKWKDRKYLVFPCVCLVGGVEKWEDKKLFCLVEKKSEMIENVVYINWLLYPYYIIDKK